MHAARDVSEEVQARLLLHLRDPGLAAHGTAWVSGELRQVRPGLDLLRLVLGWLQDHVLILLGIPDWPMPLARVRAQGGSIVC